ncbi:wolframin isoform X1 [Alosa sapidissima]|uniref:wolframin isoform X1 n=1 Tax=Alosa sapidissima TaxID=34773 RepID=UPI001C0A3D43|nr:wolframin isoform X1 [Alosa sapidissima]
MDLRDSSPTSPPPPSLENGESVIDTNPASCFMKPAKSLSTSETTTTKSPTACSDTPKTPQNILPVFTATTKVDASPGSIKACTFSINPPGTSAAPSPNTSAMSSSSSKLAASSAASLSPDSESASGTKQKPSLPRPKSFQLLAKRVIMQEKMRKAAEAESFEEEEEEEDLPFEELEEKAKGGDAKYQSQLGKYYLKLAEERDKEENEQLAVEWFVQAAKLGRKDAAKMLQRCWIQRRGITPKNDAEVRKLSTESKFEQAVRRAAMMMFQKLNPDGKKTVAMSEMLQNVDQVNAVPGTAATSIDKQKRLLENMVANESGQYVDLDHFVEITKKYTESIAPVTIQDERINDAQESIKTDVCKQESSEMVPSNRRLKRHSWGTEMMLGNRRRFAMKRAIDIKAHFLGLQYPLNIILSMKDQLVDWASRAGVQWLSTIIPTHHVNALIFFFIISNLTIDLFAFAIPLFIFYLSFIAMVICTLRIFQSSKGWENFSAITALLTRFEPSLDVEQAETNFGWNNLEQYFYFMTSVIFVIFTFPVADKGWIPCSELSTVAIFFTALSYMSLSPTAATYARKAIFIEVASSACTMTSRLPDTMVMVRMLGKTFTTVPLGHSVVLKLSLPCLLYIYLFYLFFRMARMRGFSGTYCFLVPYLVCFMWWEFSVVLLQHSTPVGLMRTCVAYFLLLFALPVLAVGLAMMLFIQMVKWFVELELTKMLVTLAVCAVPVTLRLWTRFSLSILDVFHSITHRGPVKLILICISTIILLCGVYLYNVEGLKVYNSTMTWPKYSKYCGPPAWQARGMAQTQIWCSHLEGHRVTWTGRFRHVRVAETENGAQSVINLLPVFMADWMRCLYGQAYPKCEPVNATASGVNGSAQHVLLQQQQEEEEMCQIKMLANHQCHVKRFDSYRFEVTVGMPFDGTGPSVDDPSSDIVLRASHEFQQVLLNLDPGSMVEFSTKLEGRLGAKLPVFELKAIHCLDCKSSLVPEGRQVKIERNWRHSVMRSIKFAFDFFFSPFLSARI